MSRLSPNQMTVRKLESLKEGVHSDGGNLWITVAGKSRTWSFRYQSPVTGKRREMGLGPYRDVPLADARDLAGSARKLLRQCIDPIEHRKAAREELSRQTGLTIKAVATRYIEDQKAGWRGTKSETVWTSSFERLVYPAIGDRPIGSIVTEDVVNILRRLWTTMTETADRLRGRIERVIDYARTQGWFEGENPARWRGHLAHILPKPSTVAEVSHFAAVPYKKIEAVMTALRQSTGMGAKAVRFTCLTAARSGEVRGASWSEIDLKAKIWTIPAIRMKMKRPHRVPLSAGAMEILTELKPLAESQIALLFPGGRPGKPLSDVALSKALHLAAGTKGVTVHGLRSTFRDWVAEATDYPRDVAEMALAHAIGDKVEAAYRRGDLFERRSAMMEEWGLFTAS